MALDANEKIDQLRRDIDRVDRRLVELLRLRLSLVLDVAAVKRAAGIAIYDPARERAIVERVERGRVRALYQLVVESCRRGAQAAVPRPDDGGD